MAEQPAIVSGLPAGLTAHLTCLLRDMKEATDVAR